MAKYNQAPGGPKLGGGGTLGHARTAHEYEQNAQKVLHDLLYRVHRGRASLEQ